jgi:hypothetical protein
MLLMRKKQIMVILQRVISQSTSSGIAETLGLVRRYWNGAPPISECNGIQYNLLDRKGLLTTWRLKRFIKYLVRLAM